MADNDLARAFGGVEAKLAVLIEQIADIKEELTRARADRLTTDKALALLSARVDTLDSDLREMRADLESQRPALAALRTWRARVLAIVTAAGIGWAVLLQVDLERLGKALADLGVGK